MLAGGRSSSGEMRNVTRYADSWERGDLNAMYALLSPAAKRRTSRAAFTRAHQEAELTATGVELDAGEPQVRDGVATIPVAVRTRVFGLVRGTIRLGTSGEDEATRFDWGREDAFPGVRRGERLTRRTELPPRAALLARDGRPIAKGPERASNLGAVAAEVRGSLGPAPADQAAVFRMRGYPPDAAVGLSGLERVFQDDLAGRPGGELLAGSRVIGRGRPRPGRAVRTTISPRVEEAAIAALGGRFGGVAALDPRTGEVLALAGVAFSAPQPPGSTFKIITAAGALEAGIATPRSTFPVATKTTIEGVDLENANGESCGGTLVESFAESCNSVFAPLGARLGARRLISTAEAFGFNRRPRIPGMQPSVIPGVAEIGDDLAVGSSAIGQGRVQATALHMTGVAATIAERGRRVQPTLRLGERPKPARAISPKVARQVERMMLAVVRSGTGTAAAIPGVGVAGKTGTAELEDTTKKDEPVDPAAGAVPEAKPDTTDTDAWFVAYAPARRPRIAVGVMLVRAGAGGAVAAPTARPVLLAGLKR
jgi:cell division protein FtsI/penicillin-binding protein 2